MEAPKYEVIADYPKSPFVVGQILELEKYYKDFAYIWYEDYGKELMTTGELNDYPNIFKKL